MPLWRSPDFGHERGDNPLDLIFVPEPRPLSDYSLAPCKHECNVIKHARHVRHALEVYEAMDPLHQTLMRAFAGLRGTDFAHCSSITIRDVARMDCLGSMVHAEINEESYFVHLCFTASASPTITQSSRTSRCPSFALAALLIFEIQVGTPQDQSASSPGNVMRGDARGMDAYSRPMKYLSWL